jgi:hypothetical protein
MEQSKGLSGNNIVTVLMNAHNLDLQQACDYVGVYFEKLMGRFLSAKARMPSWDPELDAAVAMYVDAMSDWIRGNLEYVYLILF